MESQNITDMPTERGVAQYQRLASLLRHRIAVGSYPMDSQLPAISQLAKELGVAVVTVRQAYELLSTEGLIRSQRGRGTHVSALPTMMTEKMQAAINDPLSNSSDVSFDVLSTVHGVDLPPELRNGLSEAMTYTCVRKVHLLSGEPFCYAEIYVPTREFNRFPKGIAKKKKLMAALLDLKGERCQLIRQRTTVAPADFPLCDLLKIPFASPVARMSRRVTDAEGVVLYGSLVWYRGDRYVAETEFPVTYLESFPGISEPKTRISR